MGIDLPDEPFQAGDLGQIDDGEEDLLVPAGVRALTVEERRPVAEIPQEGVRHLIGLLRHDEGCLPLGEADDDAPRHVGVDVHGHQRADGGLHGEEEARRGHDEAVQRKDHVADLQIVVLFHDGADHVEAAAVGIVAVQDAAAHAEEHAAGDGRHQRILHALPVGEERREVDEDGNGDGADDGDHRVEPSHEPQGKQQDRDIQQDIREPDGQPREVVHDHGDAREAPRDEVVRHKKEIDAEGIEETAHNGDQRHKKVRVEAEIIPFHGCIPF